MPRIAVLAFACVAISLSGCSASRSPQSIEHIVRRGDTLAAIGQRYRIPFPVIAAANGIDEPFVIFPGQRLAIPNRHQQRLPPRTAPPAPSSDAQLLWPVVGGRITSPFGPREGRFHDGVDISAPVGTPVRAAQRGVVTFSGVRRGYGNVIVVRHFGGISTVYAHNQSNWVQRGEAVRRGQVIASVGDTGRTTGPNLHLEVWVDGARADPLSFFAQDARVAESEIRAP